MSDQSPINDFDAYKHEWDKGFSYSTSNNADKFSLNNDNTNKISFSKYIKDFFASPIPFTKSVVAICVTIYLLSFIFPHFVTNLGYFPPNLYFHPWTILTSGFTHFTFFHIFFNMFTLYFIGNELERTFGSSVFATIYMASILGGIVFTSIGITLGIINAFTITIGASGGIFGLFGAIFVLQKKQSISRTPIIIFLILNIIMGFMFPNISLAGHLGGFVIGCVATHLIVSNTKHKSSYYYKLPVFKIIILFLFLIIICYLPCFI